MIKIIVKLIKWSILALALLFSGCVYVFIKTADTFDGRDYSRSDYVHYYFITPDLFMEPPNIPGRITYYSEGDDNYGYFQRSITWRDVADVPAAEKIIEQFFINKGYSKRQNGLVWRFYWSNYVPDPKTCDNEAIQHCLGLSLNQYRVDHRDQRVLINPRIRVDLLSLQQITDH